MAQGWQQVTISAYPPPPPATPTTPCQKSLLMTSLSGSVWTLWMDVACQSVYWEDRGEEVDRNLGRNKWPRGGNRWQFQPTRFHPHPPPHSCQKSIAGHSLVWLCLNTVKDSGCSLWVFPLDVPCQSVYWDNRSEEMERNLGTNGPGRKAGDQFQLPNQHMASLNTSVEVNRWPVSVAKPAHGFAEYQCGSQQVTSFSCQTSTWLRWIPVWKSTGDQFSCQSNTRLPWIPVWKLAVRMWRIIPL